jgi:hypothetical protein
VEGFRKVMRGLMGTEARGQLERLERPREDRTEDKPASRLARLG